MWEPINGEGVTDSESAGDITFVAPVVFLRRADVPAVNAMGCHVWALFPAGGARGLWLKSKLPFRQAYADSLGWRREEQSKLRMMSAWGMRRSHSVSGNLGSHVASPEQKWIFQVWMALSAALRR
jgi:hypothetical protein